MRRLRFVGIAAVFLLGGSAAMAQTTLRIGLAEDPDVLDPTLANFDNVNPAAVGGCQIVLVLHTLGEIAQILAIPVGTVRSRLHRGRRMLQRALWSLAEDSGIVKALSSEVAP